MNASSSERNIQAYEDAYSADYDFELVQVKYRREAVLRSLHSRRPRKVIEIGCGLEPVLPHYLASGGSDVARWVVVEPADAFVRAANAIVAEQPALVVVQGFFEDVAARIVEEHGCADMVICSGLLHEVPDQMALLLAIRSTMQTDSLLHVNVPSASSLHRRLAKASGMIETLEDMSGRNIQLQQHRVYDLALLRAELLAAGMRPVNDGGIFLKPFTHAQMRQVVQVLDVDILPGLAVLGREFPELASEIYVEAVGDGG